MTNNKDNSSGSDIENQTYSITEEVNKSEKPKRNLFSPHNLIGLKQGEAWERALRSNPDRVQVMFNLDSSVKKTILLSAKEQGTWPSYVVEKTLRNAFPDSWRDDNEKEKFEANQPPEMDWDTKSAERQLNSTKKGKTSQISVRLKSSLNDYLHEKSEQETCMLSFNALIRTTLELEFDDQEEDFNSDPDLGENTII